MSDNACRHRFFYLWYFEWDIKPNLCTLKVSDTTILATVYDKPGDYDQVGGWLKLYLSMTCMPAFTPGCS